jgi:hypothetical protein
VYGLLTTLAVECTLIASLSPVSWRFVHILSISLLLVKSQHFEVADIHSDDASACNDRVIDTFNFQPQVGLVDVSSGTYVVVQNLW